MTSKKTKFMLFLSSYFPLYIIISVTQRNVWGYYAVTPIVIGLSSIIWLLGWLLWAKQRSTEELIIKKAHSKDPEVVAYIISYMIPFATTKMSDVDSAVIVLIFFILIMVLSMNSNLVFINPVLNMLGYHLYEVELESGNNLILIIGLERLLAGQKVEVRRVSESIYLGDR